VARAALWAKCRTLIGYLLTCPRTGAQPGSVQASGSSLSHRLPVLVTWFSFGLRGPAAGRVIAAWPSFALIGSYELLMRQVRRTATTEARPDRSQTRLSKAANVAPAALAVTRQRTGSQATGRDLQQQAWRWAMANRAADGSLPSGRAIAARYGRHERWGRLVKRLGAADVFANAA